MKYSFTTLTEHFFGSRIRTQMPDYIRVGRIWATGLCVAAFCFFIGVGCVAFDYYRTFIVPEVPPLPPSAVLQYREDKIQDAAAFYIERGRIFHERRYNEGVSVPIDLVLVETVEEGIAGDVPTPPQVPQKQDSAVLAE